MSLGERQIPYPLGYMNATTDASPFPVAWGLGLADDAVFDGSSSNCRCNALDDCLVKY
jgi:hypothetical protein